MRLLGIFLLLAGCGVAVFGQDQQCPPNDTLCVAEVAAARLSAANAKITALTQINTDQKAIIEAKDQLIGVKDQIIANLQKIDTNSQKIDTLGQETNAIWREQHNEDKHMIGDLQKDIASCRNNQKWIAGLSFLGGTYFGRKTASTQIQNPFVINTPAANFAQFQSPQEKAQQALRLFTK